MRSGKSVRGIDTEAVMMGIIWDGQAARVPPATLHNAESQLLISSFYRQ